MTHTVAPGAQRAQGAQGAQRAQGAARGSHWDTLAVRLTWKEEMKMLGIWQQSMGILWGFYRISRGFLWDFMGFDGILWDFYGIL